jgi:diaminohydroxyphosphoribosylaminopyrimidine deaminase/5-amino-6-(5-phosphoribosylamino)uracil reductase
MTVRPEEIKWMRRALALARRAEGDTAHYPMVGAVIVKNGRKVAEGWFRRPGEPHAEVHALLAAGNRAKGATLVLNLEPCSHFGRTPPCADAVIRAGIRRVVAGMRDPNPLVSGRGFKKLRAAGLEVVEGAMEKECRDLNRVFVKHITTNRPYVVMKAAATLDGKIATATGEAFWITGEPARKEVHRLRDVCQAVMVGAGTVRRDDPELTVRLAGKGRQPRPIVISSRLDFPLQSKVVATRAEGGPLLFCTREASPGRIKKFEAAGAEVVAVKMAGAGRVDLKSVMRELGKRKIASVLLEGGSDLFGAMLQLGLVDEVVLFLAPKLLAGDGIPITRGPGPKRLAEAIPLHDMKIKKVGEDLMITAKVGKNSSK